MVKGMLAMSTLAVSLLLFTGGALAVDQERTQDRIQTQEQEQVYGSQLMTQQERAEYRTRINAAISEEERKQIREEHHERMKERAKAQGVTLPDSVPSVRGGGMGRGGMGGMGRGGSSGGSGNSGGGNGGGGNGGGGGGGR